MTEGAIFFQKAQRRTTNYVISHVIMFRLPRPVGGCLLPRLWIPSRMTGCYIRSDYCSLRNSLRMLVPANLSPSVVFTITTVSPAVLHVYPLFISFVIVRNSSECIHAVCAFQLAANARWNQCVYCNLSAVLPSRQARGVAAAATYLNDNGCRRTLRRWLPLSLS